MPERRNDLAQVKALLQDQVVNLAKDLAPDGYRSGKYWIAKNPTRDDRTRGSFWIALSGVPGSWRDEATGDKGDVIQLIRYLKGPDFGDAMRFARGWLGIGDMPPEKLAQASQAARERRIKADAQEEANEELRRKAAKAFWLNCWESLTGSKAERYLRERGIDLRALPRKPSALRFCPNDRHLESDETWPTIVAAMSGPKGALQAIHRTFLAKDGFGKAPVEPNRKIWPRFKGASIHLWRGKSGKPAAGAPKGSDTLVICEGVEDGLSIALACPEFRVWCAGSLGNIGNIALPNCAGRVIVACDNDWGKPAAEAQLAKGLAALAAQGVAEVFEARSPVGKDFNDCLRQKGESVSKNRGVAA